MAGFTFDIGNLSEVLKRLDTLDAKVQQEVKDEINASALNIESMAKRLAPVNMNTLRGSIYKKERKVEKGIVYTVGAKASYAAYVEFGTGGKVSIPAGFEDLANGFKGKKAGTFKDMVEALMQWGIRKGYIEAGKNAKKHAYFMAIKILKNGLRPQPFLIPAFEAEKPKLIKNILNVLKNVKS
jgi:HK97 gp10 family phage protein